MFSILNNLYWRIRNTRNATIKRRFYRYVAAEKKRLINESGVDAEELRLYCRTFSSRENWHAEKRLAAYRKSQT